MPAAAPAQLGAAGAWVALGSNLGDSLTVLNSARQALQRLSELPIRCSSWWKTSPLDCPPGSPAFYNGVVWLQPHPQETPSTLLARLQEIEREAGRRPKVVLNEPRPLDLDLIAFDEIVLRTATLILPHPRAQERRFVLEPLAELAPDWILPGQVLTVRQLLAGLPAQGAVERCGD